MDAKYQDIRTKLLAGAEVGVIDPEMLHFVESELVEDYLEGSLTHSESDLFKTNYLVTDERKDLVNELRMLKHFSSDAFEFDASIFDEPSEEKAESTRSKLIGIVAIVLVVAVIVLLAFQFLRS